MVNNTLLGKRFSQLMLDWFEQCGRKDLPWQQDVNPYRVWVSEIMLQQTRVGSVIPYFQRFMEKFADIKMLAAAKEDEVLALWSGLGYYARCRNLHKTAKIVVAEYDGKLPNDLQALQQLPGIGRSTAGAIYSLGMGQRAAILDGNCKRVYARCFELAGYPGKASVLKQFWQLAEQLTPQQDCARFNQAMMDLGATVCLRTQPLCLQDSGYCPLSAQCLALKHHSIHKYPEKKPASAYPQKHRIFLVLKTANVYFLHKRPPQGIWGGLWCFPEFEHEKALREYLQNTCQHFRILWHKKNYQHKFTHFCLNYEVIVVELADDVPARVTDLQSGYFPCQKALQLGLPTPIKSILLELDRK